MSILEDVREKKLFKMLAELTQISIQSNDLQRVHHLQSKIVEEVATHYISKADVLKALGGNEPTAPFLISVNSRNQFRSQIKKELGL